MPWVSRQQEKWGNSPAGHKALGDKGVNEWNQSSKGMNLPKKVGYSVNPSRSSSYKPKDITVK